MQGSDEWLQDVLIDGLQMLLALRLRQSGKQLVVFGTQLLQLGTAVPIQARNVPTELKRPKCQRS